MSLQLTNVKKSYQEPDGGKLQVLNIEQFSMQAGEQVVLVGSSGGGKTTMLNVISGITTPDSGSVRIDNVDICTLPEVSRDRFRAERLGYVFQTFNLLSAFTALENVLLGMSFSGKKADRSRAVALLELVGLGQRMHHRPSQLSVGEQQRVSVARALVNQPSLLLADEPTANVDVRNQENLLQLIREGCRQHNVSLLLVTHSPVVTAQFERVVQLADVNKIGTH